MVLLADVIEAMQSWFDPATAEPWDAVGLVCGDPGEPVERVLLAVDAVPDTVAEAIDSGAQLLITHHPLLMKGVHGVAADDPKGGLVHAMIRSRVAHFVAHTNADVAVPGVSDALAARLGLSSLRPLDPLPLPALDKLVVFVPTAVTDQLRAALAAAGAGAIGDYDGCSFVSEGVGSFRPLPGADPTIGTVGERAEVPESRLEMVLPRRRREPVIAALRATHPYEEPAFDIFEQATVNSRLGTGRIGTLAEAMSLREFTQHCARSLPATSWGVRAAGDPQRRVETVAVCGGAGGSLIEAARRGGADAYVTADLRHHPAVEAVTELGPAAMALVDAAHWATESPWLDELSLRLSTHFGDTADGLKVAVSTQVTDPWTLHAPSPESSPSSP
ncbi:dinuclear metal center YbgI/SA1388 family protein [Jatrophihabitans sp. GAS493]|uniref:Nif3-like dinuclear metal center hexameric protein n=1 Tax=Jatrophihabitans sp. GAS493 TaxID=1907575 RepID=UPI000BB72FD8|nr:Nif3-like dinuclear metal center hexameric protein [Jatrophihabitans sp. GAS493]SOD74431.1 dinuclear metal center YbgI/SA1388 family protein [Jatrophihabitans sp. GAS493]